MWFVWIFYLENVLRFFFQILNIKESGKKDQKHK